MLRTLYWYTHFVVTLLLETPAMYKLLRLKNKIPQEEFDIAVEKIAAKWAGLQIKASGAKLKISGLENIPRDEAVLFVSNHQSNFDIAFFLASIRKPKGYLAKIETLKIPLLRTWMKHLRCLFMDRNDMTQSAKTILEGIALLKGGYSLVVYPEGTRSKGTDMGEFKAGSFKLATKSKVKIIPVTIDGSYKIMEANKNKIKPAKVTITIHEPIITDGMPKEEQAALCQRVKDIIQSAL